MCVDVSLPLVALCSLRLESNVTLSYGPLAIYMPTFVELVVAHRTNQTFDIESVLHRDPFPDKNRQTHEVKTD